ncbi:hypothetical protein ASPWEDRAFT_43276 [Aspergillus wentii DTO 134E9]|uniref:Mitochondrial fission process protein 1 n=1 Tax=Aspergillus wentii DTO 134E9 TaxID=1073089 RepID=A0A1L9RE50_ASPWE|nr:uncharacterized protein ASPWEDRAFT_43276 [Aspergillus wentii DTO 134E9]KAI9933460.1 hypothetical protein MW887_007933 [Aspergillus wentii]OJJ33202.1 hypothetical protein ASPWEDRAFT_43276 [Aspergillus wentii DTO 134E9]
MLWGSHQDEAAASSQKPVPRQKLPSSLQKLVDRDDSFYDDVYSPYSVDSTDTPYRYAAYANRIRTILLSAHRYVAYTSDIGESFRPVAHPHLVRTAYGISWAYLLGDVGHEGYKAYLRNRRVLAPPSESYKDASNLSEETILKGMATGNLKGPLTSEKGAVAAAADTLTPWPTTSIPLLEDYRVVMAKRAVFQGLASMGLPAFTIHSVVKYSGRMFKNSKITLFRTWAPIGLGLSVVPFLPYIFDEPVGEAVEWTFRTALGTYFGEDAVRPLPPSASSPDEDNTSLSRFLNPSESKTTLNNSVSASTSTSWEEYKEERQRARESRKQERVQTGKTGPLALLGLKDSESGNDSKSKTE